MAQSFAERVIVITGASSGIGRALALELAAEKPRLVLAARNAQRLEDTAAAAKQRGAEVLVVPTDVTDEKQCRRLIDETVRHFGCLDILVNNAGQAMWTRFEALPDVAILDELMQVNYLAAARLTLLALPHVKQSRGLVVGISSVSGLVGVPLLSGYCASKHAVLGFFDSLRIELAGTGVDVTVVAPDFVQSEILSRAVDASGKPLDTSPIDQTKLLSSEKCARRIVKAMRRRQRLALTSERSAWARWGKLLAPGLVDRITARSVGWK